MSSERIDISSKEMGSGNTRICRSRGMRRACRVALQLRLSSVCSSSVAGPSRSIVGKEHRRSKVSVSMSEKDEKLIQRGEFYGVAATSGRRENAANSPELALSRIHDHLRLNYRVNPENVMTDLVLRLEKGDEALISLLRRAPERWIPMSIQCCGRALSSIKIESRRVISHRLWKEMEKRDLLVSIDSINAYLRVQLENEDDFDVMQVLKLIEEKMGLVPNQETFHLLLEKASLNCKTSTFNNCVGEMALRGYTISDPIAHSHLVYSATLRKYDKEADSLLKEAVTKYGSEGEVFSLGAACVASADNGNINRLREMLRRSVDDELRLRLTIDDVFETIWKLSEKKGDDVKKYTDVINEILDRTRHPTGFFRFLYREIERHISASHFHTSMILLEETLRVKDSLMNQDRNLFAEQLVGKMCRAMVRSKIDKEVMMDMANRMATRLHSVPSRFVHDELMLAALTLKDFEPDERFSFFSSLLPIVDPNKERPHLIFPLLAVTGHVDDRLKLIYRASSLGYSNLVMLDTNLMSTYLFQPMYNHQEWIASQRNVVDPNLILTITNILHSYGVQKSSVWHMMNEWWKKRKEEEKDSRIERRMKPLAAEIQRWLRKEYSSIFTSTETSPILPLTRNRLERAIEKGESSIVLSLLSTHGWPEDVDLSETAPRILQLLLENQTNANIMKWLNQLSGEAISRQERGQDMKTPLDSSHILKVLRHRVNESRPPAQEITEMAFEMKRLFPQAVFNQESFMETINETNRLVSACFIFKEGDQLTMDAVNGIIELLRTLMKLDIVVLAQHGETVTPFCVQKVLRRFGWSNALRLWLHFQSSLSLGNGMAILLSYTLNRKMGLDKEKTNIEFVTHKAQSCLPISRIHALYAATLVNTEHPEKRENETIEYFKKHGSEMTPFDCAISFRVINALKYPVTGEYFVRTFPSLCLAHTSLAEDKDQARNMLHSALKFSEAKRLRPLVGEMCELFAQYGIEPDEKEKRKIDSAMQKHEDMVNRWIFSPQGFVQATPEQEFVKENEWRKYVRRPGRDHFVPS